MGATIIKAVAWAESRRKDLMWTKRIVCGFNLMAPAAKVLLAADCLDLTKPEKKLFVYLVVFNLKCFTFIALLNVQPLYFVLIVSCGSLCLLL